MRTSHCYIGTKKMVSVAIPALFLILELLLWETASIACIQIPYNRNCLLILHFFTNLRLVLIFEFYFYHLKVDQINHCCMLSCLAHKYFLFEFYTIPFQAFQFRHLKPISTSNSSVHQSHIYSKWASILRI